MFLRSALLWSMIPAAVLAQTPPAKPGTIRPRPSLIDNQSSKSYFFSLTTLVTAGTVQFFDAKDEDLENPLTTSPMTGSSSKAFELKPKKQYLMLINGTEADPRLYKLVVMMNAAIATGPNAKPLLTLQFLHIQWNRDILSKMDLDKRLKQLNITLPENKVTRYLDQIPKKPFEFDKNGNRNVTLNRPAYQNPDEGAFITIKD